jgi:hypothetical protein
MFYILMINLIFSNEKDLENEFIIKNEKYSQDKVVNKKVVN